MSFKILLIAVFNDSEGELWEELGICSIASVLRKNGYEVMLKAGVEKRIDYNEMTGFNPDIIGIPVYNNTKEAVYRFCTKVKKELPHVQICLGGYMPSYCGIEMMKEAAFIDYVIRGEGEAAFLDLVVHLEKGKSLESITGLTYRSGSAIQVTPDRRKYMDMEELPFPARDIWLENKLSIASISTSRGCMSRCHFCSSPHFWGKWRGRSIPNFLNEMQYLYNLGARRFNFIDCSFEDPDQNCERLRAMAQGIVDLKLDISYFADVRAELYKKADEQLIGLLKKSGLRYVACGIETANELDCNLYGKRASLTDNHKIIEFLKKHDIGVLIGFINFNPYSTFEGLRQNIDYLEKYGFASNFDFILNRFLTFKGSYLYKKIEKDGLMKNSKFDDPLGYEYIDSRIQQLANYINNYISTLNLKTGNAIDEIYYTKDYYLNLLFHYKAVFRDRLFEKALTATRDHEKNLWTIFNELNRRNARWFREILSLAEQGWDIKSADAIMATHIDKKFIMDTNAALKLEKYSFTYGVLSLGPEYEKFFFRENF